MNTITKEEMSVNLDDYGFGEKKKPLNIYINNNLDGTYWYRLEDKKPVSINLNEVTGRLVKIDASKDTEYKGKISRKIDFYLQVKNGNIVKIRSGLTTAFSRGVLIALINTKCKVHQPIAISPSVDWKDPQSKVVFGNVSQDGEVIFAGADEWKNFKVASEGLPDEGHPTQPHLESFILSVVDTINSSLTPMNAFIESTDDEDKLAEEAGWAKNTENNERPLNMENDNDCPF